MYETTYQRASSVDDAAARFAKGKEAKYLAGGQTLLPVMKQRLASPSDVIDLSKLADLIGCSGTPGGARIGCAAVEVALAVEFERVQGGLLIWGNCR